MILRLFGGFLFFYKSISDKHEWLYSQYTVSSLEWTIKPKIIRKSRFFLIFFFKSSNCCTLFGKNFYFLTSQNKKLFWKYSEFRNYSNPFSVSLMRNIYPWVNVLPQNVQGSLLMPSWTLEMCNLRPCFLLKFFPQVVHLYSVKFSPLCILS